MVERFVYRSEGDSPKLILIGDSHTIAIGHGFRESIAEDPSFFRNALEIRNMFPGWASSEKLHERTPSRATPVRPRMRAGL